MRSAKPQPYDAVIIATPLSLSGIAIQGQLGPSGTLNIPSTDKADPQGMPGIPGQREALLTADAADMDDTHGSDDGVQGRLRAAAASPVPEQEYQTTVTTWVKGQIDPSFFGTPTPPPGAVFATDSADLPFTSIAPKVSYPDFFKVWGWLSGACTCDCIPNPQP